MSPSASVIRARSSGAQYANNPIEADHSQLKHRLRPMRVLRTDKTAQVIIAGHAFMQNVRHGHYELAIDAPPATRGRRGVYRTRPGDLTSDLRRVGHVRRSHNATARPTAGPAHGRTRRARRRRAHGAGTCQSALSQSAHHSVGLADGVVVAAVSRLARVGEHSAAVRDVNPGDRPGGVGSPAQGEGD
ncbi:DDE-type integrase/transposase/recombinase [Micromonospora rubida]|uniref:DDE-type integrase/transposase/recombinase n=1 Tax=Micromonospora rubida TaxID=2697657 RepID=A0ABW7SJI2_9ACTN